MASLNTLRTRFGVVLSIIIGLALLAFVLSLKTEMGFSGNDPKVGVIDGDKIKYSEYIAQYDVLKAHSGASEGDAEHADMLADATWQELISKHVLEPGFEKMGISATEAERLAMVSGERYSQVFNNAFANPRTGHYSPKTIADFLAKAETDPQARQAWNFLNQQAVADRAATKYVTLLKGGVFVNDLETALGVAGANTTYSGRWARRRYSTLPDSLFTVSASEIRSYYKDHKNEYRQVPSRTVTYVVFDVNPTDDDMLALENTVTGVGTEFAAAEDVRAFVRGNRNGRIDDRFVSAAQLPEDEAEALMAGRPYGPVLKNNIWTMSRVVDTKVAPDTLGIRHIVLPFSETKLADSLLNVLRGGGDFAKIARQYSVYGVTAELGGEVGVMPFSAFTGEFAAELANVKTGDIVKIASGDAIQLMHIYRADKPSKHMQVATIAYPVEASADTRRAIHNAAGTFSVNAKGTSANFNDAAAAAAVTPRVGVLNQGERQLRGLDDSRELVRWAYGAEKNDVSEIFTIDGDYVIAMVTGINKAKYAPLEEMELRIRMRLLRDKKYDYIVSDAAGKTFAELSGSIGASETGDFSGVNSAAFYIDGVGLDPRLVGTITGAKETGYVSAPVKGMNGVYLIEVTEITNDEKQTSEAEKVREQAMLENMIQQRSVQTIQQMADIEDLRGRYF